MANDGTNDTFKALKKHIGHKLSIQGSHDEMRVVCDDCQKSLSVEYWLLFGFGQAYEYGYDEDGDKAYRESIRKHEAERPKKIA